MSSVTRQDSNVDDVSDSARAVSIRHQYKLGSSHLVKEYRIIGLPHAQCTSIAAGLSASSPPTSVSHFGSTRSSVPTTDLLGHDFWTCFIPQVTHTSPVVRSAVMSAASVLESTRSRGQSQLKQIESRARHLADVRFVIEAAEYTDPEYVLIACLIFASCELVLGALDAGMLHLKAGSEVLKERMASLAQNNLSHGLAASVLSEHIRPIFAAYSQITSIYGIDLVSAEALTRAAHHNYTHMPAYFVNTDQAHAHLRSIVHQIFSQHYPQLSAGFGHLQTKLEQWTTALDTFESRQETTASAPSTYPITCFLRNQHRLAQVFLSIARSGEETSPCLFDRFAFDLTWILAQHSSMKFDKVFVYERVELIAPLFIIATKTRSKEIRNEALRLLEAMERVEANWDSKTALLIARALLESEDGVNTSLVLAAKNSGTLPTKYPRICIHSTSGMWVSTQSVLCASR